jgi:hypothetical protein
VAKRWYGWLEKKRWKEGVGGEKGGWVRGFRLWKESGRISFQMQVAVGWGEGRYADRSISETTAAAAAAAARELLAGL